MGSSLSVVRRDNRRAPHVRMAPDPPADDSMIRQSTTDFRPPRAEKPNGSNHGTATKTHKPARSFAARHGVIDPRGIT